MPFKMPQNKKYMTTKRIVMNNIRVRLPYLAPIKKADNFKQSLILSAFFFVLNCYFRKDFSVSGKVFPVNNATNNATKLYITDV